MRLRAVRAIGAVALRRLARDRRSLLFTLALPFTVILLVGLAFGGETGAVDLAVAGTDSRETDAVLAALRQERALDVRFAQDEAELRDLVSRARVAAGLVLADGRPPLLITPADSDGGRGARPLVGAALARLKDPGAVPPEVLVERVGQRSELAGLGRFGYTAPANLVLFTFITTLAAASGLIETRLIGVRRRTLAAPVSAGQVIAGEALGRFLIALLQSLVVIAGASLLFGVSWGSPAGVVAVAGLFALVATSAALLLGTLLRTPQQASAIGPIAGIALGMLGGCMWPLEIVGPAMRQAGHATPHAWAVDALVALGGGGAGIGEVWRELAALALFSALLLPLAVWRLRRGGV